MQLNKASLLQLVIVLMLLLTVLVDSSVRILSMAYDGVFLAVTYFVLRELIKELKKPDKS